MQVPQVGLAPSHLSFLLRHKTQAILLGLFAASSFWPSWLFLREGLRLASVDSFGRCERSLKYVSSGVSGDAGGIFATLTALERQNTAPQPVRSVARKQQELRADARGFRSARQTTTHALLTRKWRTTIAHSFVKRFGRENASRVLKDWEGSKTTVAQKKIRHHSGCEQYGTFGTWGVALRPRSEGE